MRKLYIVKFLVIILFAFLLFSKSSAQFVTVDTNVVNLGGGYYQLTSAYPYETGYLWNPIMHDLNVPLKVKGKFNFGSNPTGADGICFVLQNQCAGATGQAGGGLGYNKMPGNSIAVEFDTFQNIIGTGVEDNADPAFDHIAVEYGGNLNHSDINTIFAPVPMKPAQPNVKDGFWHDFIITYDQSNKLLNVTFDGVPRIINFSIDIQTTIFGSNPYVFWGFSSSTGGQTNHQLVYINDSISSVTLRDTTICNAQSVTVKLPPLAAAFNGKNLALNKHSYTSSTQSPPYINQAKDAFDGNYTSRWESAWSVDPQWIYVDLGDVYDIDSVVLKWEGAYASEYEIDFSTDAISWNPVFTTSTGDGGYDIITTPVSNIAIRYVRMYGTKRATGYGYSLWEFKVLGKGKYSWTSAPQNNSTISPNLNSDNPTFSPTVTTTYTVSIADPCIPNSQASFTVTVSCPQPLTFLSFDVIKNEDIRQLKWITANENNTSYFIIEKSDGIGAFYPIGKLTSVNAVGIHSYSFIDNTFLSGTVYYRIVQYDIDGSFDYSVTKSITSISDDLIVIPNPCNGLFILKGFSAIEDEYTITIHNTIGQIILYKTVSSKTAIEVNLDISEYSPGTYILHATSSRKNFVRKIVKR